MKRPLALLCLYICIPLCAQHSSPIKEAMANYDYETALSLIAEETPSPQLTFQKAQALRGLNRYSEALIAFREVTEMEPDNFRAIMETAECCKQAGRFTESLNCYEQALALNPDNKYVQLQRIMLLCAMDQYTKAAQICHEVMQSDSSATITRLMAQTQEGLMKKDSAVHYYTKVIEKEPNDYISVAKLANLYINQNAPQEAIEITENYRQTDTTNIYVNRQNAQAYCLKKDYITAIDRYEHLVSQGDSTRMTCYYLGMSYYAIEDYYGAHDFLRIAYKYDPKNINILYYLGRACSKTSWKKEGVELLNEAIQIATPSDSTMVNLYNGLIDGYKLAGMYKEQIDTYKELHKKYTPQRHTLIYSIGAAYQDYLRDYKNAERYLEMFLKTRPKTNDNTPQIEEGTLVLGVDQYYKAAERRLATIRKEQFFTEGQSE